MYYIAAKYGKDEYHIESSLGMQKAIGQINNTTHWLPAAEALVLRPLGATETSDGDHFFALVAASCTAIALRFVTRTKTLVEVIEPSPN